MAKPFLPVSRHPVDPETEIVLAGRGYVIRHKHGATRLQTIDALRTLSGTSGGATLQWLTAGLCPLPNRMEDADCASLCADLNARHDFLGGASWRRERAIAIAALPPKEELRWELGKAPPDGLFTLSLETISSSGATYLRWVLGGHGADRGFIVEDVPTLARELSHGDSDKKILNATPLAGDQLLLIRRGAACVVNRGAALVLADWLRGRS